MSEIVTSIRHVANIAGEIITVSAEQRKWVAHLGETVSQMDQATQKAALVEQSAAAGGSLRQQAQLLLNAVAAFEQSPLTIDERPGSVVSGAWHAVRVRALSKW